MSRHYRPELPPPPPRIARLPRDRGYPVPWFVAWIDGVPDFRVVGPGKLENAMRYRRCWICGNPLGRYVTYVVGPMCAVNRVSSEPGSHRECAEYAARACPFLVRPHMVRREAGKPEEAVEPAGVMLRRNPGVALVWTTDHVRQKPVPGGGFLLDLGEPRSVAWYAEGREATHAEVMASIESGIPTLQEMAEQEGPAAVAELHRLVTEAIQLLPAPEPEEALL